MAGRHLIGILGGVAALLALLLMAPAFDAFEAGIAATRWYVGVPQPPKKGWLRLPKHGWIVSRGIPEKRIRRLEIVFRHKGGALEVTFHGAREPLSNPQGDAIVVPRGKGVRTLVVTKDGAALNGEDFQWDGTLRGTFRLRALKGDVEIDVVNVEPRTSEPPEVSELERSTVHFPTTPPLFRDDQGVYSRVTLMLWDVDVCFLLRKGEPAFRALKAPVRGAPVLGALVTAGDARALAMKAGSHPLAMRDWGDERRNLARGAFLKYLHEEYARFALIQDAQRALNAALPARKDLEPLVHLAVIRHAPNARAATALAETQGAKRALALLKRALGRDGDLRRASGDRLRKAAGVAARAVLGEPPPQWPGFAFDPVNRFVTVEQGKDLLR